MAALGLAFVLGAAVAGCGSDDDDTATRGDGDRTTTTVETTTTTPPTTEAPPVSPPTTTPAGGAPAAAISLTLDVAAAAGQAGQPATLSCSDTAEGTGFLADPAAAQAACDLLRTNSDAVRRLVEGRSPDLLCIELYGGPEVATVSGQIDGRPVETTIDRTDGCGIADWDSLAALLGPAG